MIRFSRDKVLLLHQLLIAETGGAADVRDFGLLESALESAYATFDGQELYPSKEEKGARFGYALISNHAFVDGNKRIGMYVMLTFLEVNGVHLNGGRKHEVRRLAGLGAHTSNLSSTPCAALCRAAGGGSGWRFPRPAHRHPAGH